MIGLSTYAFFWQWQAAESDEDRPLSLREMIDRTADLGVGMFQICDYRALTDTGTAELADLVGHAQRRGVGLELGTRGLRPDVLDRYLELALALDATLVRSMINSADHRPTSDEAVELLRKAMPAYEAAGVTLALETYEQIAVATLVDIVEQVDSPALGICLDPGNCVAALELPRTTIEATSRHVRNLHVKDFAFARQEGWVGFTFSGCRLGEGLLDYDFMIDAVRPDERGVNQIIEHWLPWQGDRATTIQTENQWIDHNLQYLRSRAR